MIPEKRKAFEVISVSSFFLEGIFQFSVPDRTEVAALLGSGYREAGVRDQILEMREVKRTEHST